MFGPKPHDFTIASSAASLSESSVYCYQPSEQQGQIERPKVTIFPFDLPKTLLLGHDLLPL